MSCTIMFRFGKAARKAVKADAVLASECRKLETHQPVPILTLDCLWMVWSCLVGPSGHTAQIWIVGPHPWPWTLVGYS